MRIKYFMNIFRRKYRNSKAWNHVAFNHVAAILAVCSSIIFSILVRKNICLKGQLDLGKVVFSIRYFTTCLWHLFLSETAVVSVYLNIERA